MRELPFLSLSWSVTREQHQAILAFIEQTVSGDLPPMDVEADAIIRALFVRNPDAAYRMTMLAMRLAAAARAAEPAETARRKHWLAALFERRAAVALRPVGITS